MSEATYHRWRNQFGGLKAEDARRVAVSVARNDDGVDFAMRYDRWYYPVATITGLGPARTTIRVADGTLQVQHGWAFGLDAPLADVTGARRVDGRRCGWGVHTLGDVWVVNGSRNGMVEIGFGRAVTSKAIKRMQQWGEVRKLLISVTDPDEFVAALTGPGRTEQ